MKTKTIIITTCAAICMLFTEQCHAQNETEVSVLDDNDEYIRENPDMPAPGIEEEAGSLVVNYKKYPFLHLKANKIELNGANWSRLKQLLAMSGDTTISIVHIGDSHLQGEGSTQRTRSLLQKKYGSAGRGLIIPFKLTGTNQSSDYETRSNSHFSVSKLMRKPWDKPMGFTGVSLRPTANKFDFTISVKRSEGSEPDFDIVKMYCGGALPKLITATADGSQIGFTATPEDGYLEIFLHEPAETVKLDFASAGECQVYGFQLQNQMTGVEYSAIGNNGATYYAYNSIGSMGKSLQALSPDLVILSLGNNEAFGDVSDDTFYGHIRQMVNDIKKYNPNAAILLTTPGECQKSTVTYMGAGKRRKASRSYGPNAKCETMRNVVLRYGKDNNVATWDWYDVAGGKGSSAQWLSSNLLGADRIHNTWDGYKLQGNLLYEALVKAVEK